MRSGFRRAPPIKSIGRPSSGSSSPQGPPRHRRGRTLARCWYTIVNDISARDRLARPDAVAPPFGFDWFSAKAEDTFCPIGPGIVPDWQITDPQSLSIKLSVNGAVKQDSNTPTWCAVSGI